MKSNPASSRAPGSSSPSRSRGRWSARLFERLLLGIGTIAIAIVAGAQLESSFYQRRLEREFERLAPASTAATPKPRPVSAVRATLRDGGLIGRIEVPRLGVSAMVGEGVGKRTLRVAVGHVPGTALPGESGNVAVAGHRDTFFRALRNIAAADTVRVNTIDGFFSYRVDSTFVVGPERVDLLAPTDEPALTMITCYPFNYVGPAPRRFVIRAHQIGSAP